MTNFDKYKAILTSSKHRAERGQLIAGQRLRDAAIEQVGNAYQAWIARRLAFIRSLPTGREFTTDQVWAAASAADHKIAEPRAMGAVMVEAQALRLIRPTGSYMKSSRPACHARPVAIWERL